MRKAMVLGVVTLAGSLASPAFADEFSGFRLGLLLNFGPRAQVKRRVF